MGLILLDAIASEHEPFAVLHGEAEIAAGRISSDIDLTVTAPPDNIVAALLASCEGFEVVMVWPYDRESTTYFIVDIAAVAESAGAICPGVQLDLVFDPNGRGRYGFRTEELVTNSVPGNRWPRLHPADEFLYLLRKRQVKRDRQRVTRLLDNPPLEASTLKTRAHEAFSAPAAAELCAMLDQNTYIDPRGAAFDRRLRNVLANPGHYMSRMSQRVGWWFALGNVERTMVESAMAPLAELFPRINIYDSPRSSVPASASRWRAELSLTLGDGDCPGVDDRLVGCQTPDQIRQAVIQAMAARSLNLPNSRNHTGIAQEEPETTARQ